MYYNTEIFQWLCGKKKVKQEAGANHLIMSLIYVTCHTISLIYRFKCLYGLIPEKFPLLFQALITTYSILIPDLFQQRNTKQQPTLFHSFTNKENTKQQPHLFCTYSNKETQSNSPTYSAPFPTKKTQSNDLGWKLGLRLPPYALHVSFPSPVLPPSLPCTEATPMPAQEPILSTPSPALLNAFTEQFFDRSQHCACTPAVSCSLICPFPS